MIAAAQEQGEVGGAHPSADPIDLPLQRTDSLMGISVHQITGNGHRVSLGRGFSGDPSKPGFVAVKIGDVQQVAHSNGVGKWVINLVIGFGWL